MKAARNERGNGGGVMNAQPLDARALTHMLRQRCGAVAAAALWRWWWWCLQRTSSGVAQKNFFLFISSSAYYKYWYRCHLQNQLHTSITSIHTTSRTKRVILQCKNPPCKSHITTMKPFFALLGEYQQVFRKKKSLQCGFVRSGAVYDDDDETSLGNYRRLE